MFTWGLSVRWVYRWFRRCRLSFVTKRWWVHCILFSVSSLRFWSLFENFDKIWNDFTWILMHACSYNFDKLASSCYILFSSCCTKNETFWAQAVWSKGCDGIWDSQWNFNWTFEFELGFQFCWILSGFFPSLFRLRAFFSLWIIFISYAFRWQS